MVEPSTSGFLQQRPIIDHLQAWIRNDSSAAAHLQINIKSSLVLYLDDDTHAHTIWNILHAHFERTNGVIVLHARSNLVGCRYRDGQDLRKHLDRMSTLW
jgi:gag-polypeptide of LTR copia-type